MLVDRSTVRFVSGVVAGATLAFGVGCVPNSSNLSVSILSAERRAEEVAVELRIDNPGGRDVTLTQVEYELSEAETGLPLAGGEWAGELAIHRGAGVTLALLIGMQSQPLDGDFSRVRLSGDLRLQDHTGFFGIRSLELTSSAFQVEADVRSAP